MFGIKTYLRNKIRNLKYKKNNVYIALSANIDKNSVFEGANKIYGGCLFSGEMGYGTYIANNTILNTVKIGRFCSISQNVLCHNDTHPISEPFVSTSPMFYSLLKQNGETFAKEQSFEEYKYVDSEKKYSLIIGNDVWVGYGATFIGAIKVGDGAIIGAHAVCTKNVPPYAVVGGVPAKIIKYRYDEETINFLLKLKWWEKDIEWLRKNAELIRDIKKLKKEFDCLK